MIDVCSGCGRADCICGNPRAQLQAQEVALWEWIVTDGTKTTRGVTASWEFAMSVVRQATEDMGMRLIAASGRNRNIESVYRKPNGQEIRATVRRVEEVEL